MWNVAILYSVDRETIITGNSDKTTIYKKILDTLAHGTRFDE